MITMRRSKRYLPDVGVIEAEVGVGQRYQRFTGMIEYGISLQE